jgi:hypothetical protein
VIKVTEKNLALKMRVGKIFLAKYMSLKVKEVNDWLCRFNNKDN